MDPSSRVVANQAFGTNTRESMPSRKIKIVSGASKTAAPGFGSLKAEVVADAAAIAEERRLLQLERNQMAAAQQQAAAKEKMLEDADAACKMSRGPSMMKKVDVQFKAVGTLSQPSKETQIDGIICVVRDKTVRSHFLKFVVGNEIQVDQEILEGFTFDD